MSESQKVVIITGGTKGLGRELAVQFAAKKYAVVALYKSDEKTASEFNVGKAVKLDITSDEVDSVLSNLEEVKNASSITLILNAWPAFKPEPFHLSNWQSFDSQLQVAMKGAYQCTKSLLRSMVRLKNGTVISVLSKAVSPPAKGFSAYVTAKSALQGFTKSIAAEYGAKGVRAFTVSPGFMETDLTREWDSAFKSEINSVKKVAKRIVDLEADQKISATGEDHSV